jgi:hypothetical protein
MKSCQKITKQFVEDLTRPKLQAREPLLGKRLYPFVCVFWAEPISHLISDMRNFSQSVHGPLYDLCFQTKKKFSYLQYEIA